MKIQPIGIKSTQQVSTANKNFLNKIRIFFKKGEVKLQVLMEDVFVKINPRNKTVIIDGKRIRECELPNSITKECEIQGFKSSKIVFSDKDQALLDSIKDYEEWVLYRTKLINEKRYTLE